jgi:mannose-6-phosphate isomerase-like protein (cupin superfamily)
MIVRRDSLTPISFGGLRVFDYTANQELGSSVAYIEVPPAAHHAEAWSRRSDKYYLVATGRIQFTLEGQSFDLGRGDFCYVPRGNRFRYRNVSSELSILVLIHTPHFKLEDEIFVDAG